MKIHSYNTSYREDMPSLRPDRFHTPQELRYSVSIQNGTRYPSPSYHATHHILHIIIHYVHTCPSK
uniref:Uncharacterized protein n=1 Tax=Arundo donax TaxID=35708 RepID=A0A0A8XN87_ARUDO